jgi:hypothetical protein
VRRSAPPAPTAPDEPDTSEDSFASRFRQAWGTRIRWDGRTVHRVVPRPVVGPSRIVIHRVATRPDREQVLHLSVSRGRFRLGRRAGRTLRLRAGAAPPRLELAVDGDVPALVRVWNGWVDEGIERMWSGNAGILVERSGAGWLLQCSDGPGPPDFSDLVVLLQLTARATPVIDLRPAPPGADVSPRS